MTPTRPRAARPNSVGQVLVLFVLFLLVLLGVSALGVDYVTWLLTDRTLQNYSDHAALAGASEFDLSQPGVSCGSLPATCTAAREQAWKSLANDLDLRDASNAALGGLAISALAAIDSPVGGQADGTYGGQSITFGDKIWVTTPPPNFEAYLAPGGRYAQNYGVVFVRVDRQVRAFFGGAIGIQPGPRTGWATAGALPMDFALETFCRNHIAPQSGVCEGSAGVHVAGTGVYVRVKRGDIASNESLKVTGNGGIGVIVETGNFYLVNNSCQPSWWNCPNGPPSLGGISDGTNGKNAFYMAPLPVPQFASPLGNASTPLADTSETDENCVGADADHLCVPYRPAGNSPGVWFCDNGDVNNLCGLPDFTVPGTVGCLAQTGGGTPDNHLDPVTGGSMGNANGTPNQNAANSYRNIDDDYTVPDPDTTGTPPKPPTDFLYVNNMAHSNGGNTVTSAFTFNLKEPFGTPMAGLPTTVRFVAFKTDGGAMMGADSGYPIELTVSLLRAGTSVGSLVVPILPINPTPYSFNIGAGILDAANGDYNNLSMTFSYRSINQVRNNAMHRGGGMAWAEAETPALEPVTALPPMIPPGYYHSIEIDAGGCALMDPTGVYSGLEAYQMPGIYRFEGDGSAKIEIGDGGALIGDGVTLVFDYGFPDPAGNKGLVIGDDAVLAINTSRVLGVPICTPTEPADTAIYNPSSPLVDLPVSSVCAGWGVDQNATAVFRPGLSAWPYCDPADVGQPQCVDRSAYSPSAGYRGVSFYFTPNAWPATDITGRFQMGGGAGSTPGIAFEGVLYAPYDDVKMSGGCNGFNQVGQVLSWTVKFNGGCGYIELDYPYPKVPAAPYLLEPTVSH